MEEIRVEKMVMKDGCLAIRYLVDVRDKRFYEFDDLQEATIKAGLKRMTIDFRALLRSMIRATEPAIGAESGTTPCLACDGSGLQEGTRNRCHTCAGSGVV
jgi:hypothetical protein